jgi:hypothetical protein
LTLSGIGRYCLAPINRKGVVIGYGAASETEIRQAWTCWHSCSAQRSEAGRGCVLVLSGEAVDIQGFVVATSEAGCHKLV